MKRTHLHDLIEISDCTRREILVGTVTAGVAAAVAHLVEPPAHEDRARIPSARGSAPGAHDDGSPPGALVLDEAAQVAAVRAATRTVGWAPGGFVAHEEP